MSTRRTDYGRRPAAASAAHGRQIAGMKRIIASQPAGAGFTTAPPVPQWKCAACGNENPGSRDKCRFCGEKGGDHV